MLLKEDAIEIRFYESGTCKSRMYIYKCRQCSGEVRARSNKLENHSGLCFGCSLANRTLRPYESTHNAMLLRHSRNELTGVPIPYEEFLAFTDIKQCHYCSREINWSKTRNGRIAKQTGCVNLDRLDFDIGYSAGNLVVCCWSCNFVRSNLIPYEAMLEIGPILAKYNVQGRDQNKRSPVRPKLTKSQRSANCQRGSTATNQTGFRGVHIDHARNCFIAKARKSNRIVFLGRHDTAEAAARAYDAYAMETYGEHANLNFSLPVAA